MADKSRKKPHGGSQTSDLMVRPDEENTITLKSEEQLAFWSALNETPELTEAQRELGAIMRGEK